VNNRPRLDTAAFFVVSTGAVVPTTISVHCCSIPFSLNGNIHYSCTDNGTGVGCFYGDWEWKQCKQPASEFPRKTIPANLVLNLEMGRYIENFDNRFFSMYRFKVGKSRRSESMDINGISFPFCSITWVLWLMSPCYTPLT